MSKNDNYWCAFARLTKTASGFVNCLYNHFQSIELAWHAEVYDLWKIEGIRKSQIDSFLEERKSISPDESLEYIQKRGFGFIHPESDDYPFLLRQIDNPPTGLFVQGSIKDCNLERTLAVVGSRRASENSKNTLRKLLENFADTDICIVSGLAEGIDTVAHKTALDNRIKTIAVIGGGFDKLYPKSNKALFSKIIDGNGAVLTEYWPDSDAISWHFPVRNRIVSGLSKGVLVAEAALKSGAMITARLALEQGKELMCMPGLISNPNTEGVYKLLKNGAALVTKSQDILDALGWVINIEKTSNQNNLNLENYSSDEKVVLEYLQKDSLTLDELAVKTNKDINTLLVIITKLELSGAIIQSTGDKYLLASNSL
ncbi:MAG: DNA-processing protein DprA [Candidatus Gastranaerophilales bacterium]|nr:DNA-processing protein DprA [Candidatus Gastranaerophilales bacterium]